MRLLSRSTIAIFLLAALLIFPQPNNAQERSTPTCMALIRTAMEQVGSNCADLGPNQVCYGYNNVESLLDDAAALTEPLSEMADQIAITEVAVVSASAFNLIDGTWGIAPLRSHANLPVALPGKGLVLMPIGDVEIENGIEPTDALILPEAALPVITVSETPLFSEASAESQNVGKVPAGSTLQADGISLDGTWLRVYYEYPREYSIRATAWVNRTALRSGADFDGLPVILPDSQTPMQTFYLRNAFTEPACRDVPPPILFVQGPDGIETDFTVNGAKVRISSSITLRLRPPGNIMELAVLSGIATLNPDMPSPLILPAGFVTEICLTELRNLGIDRRENDREVGPNCTWSAPRQMTNGELRSFGLLPNIPANVLNYSFTLPKLVCPSGVGRPICQIVIDNPRLLAVLRRLCERGILPPFICRLIRF